MPPPPQEPAAGAGRAAILLFGDSITEYAFEEGGWASRLAHAYRRKADVVARGYSGYNSAQALRLAPHVLDASLPPRESAAQRAAVHDTLRALGFSEGRLRHGMIEVYNKCDELGEPWQRPSNASWLALPVSAATGEGIPLLRHAIDAAAQLAACHGAPSELRSRDERARDAAALEAAEALT